MFLELAKFASLLLGILSLDAVLHIAFLEPGRTLEQQLVPALRMLLLAAAVCLASGYTFRLWERQTKHRDLPLARSLPMMLFWWSGGVMSLLFALGWILERYFPLS